MKKKKIGKFGLMEMSLIALCGEMEQKIVKNGKKKRLELETLNLTFIRRLVSLASSLYIFFVLLFIIL
jgi:hypothetical protein